MSCTSGSKDSPNQIHRRTVSRNTARNRHVTLQKRPQRQSTEADTESEKKGRGARASRGAALPEGWTPTDDNINALPAPLRRYIHDIETKCDPAGDIRTIAVLRDHLEAFSRLSAERQRDLGAAREELAKLKDWRADVTVAFASSWWSAL